MEQVYETILALEATKSKNEKIAILKANDSPALREVLVAALDPFTTYGIKQLPDYEWRLDREFSPDHWTLLDDLAARRLTGNAARETIANALATLRPAHADLFTRILLKDLRAGIDVSTVNKAFPKLIATFSCMLAEPFDPKRVKSWPVIVQPKLDGVRTLVRVDVDAEEVRFLSRNGLEFTSFESLAPIVLERARVLSRGNLPWRRFMLDGEVTAGAFLSTVGAVKRKKKDAADAVLNVFDVLPVEVFEGGAAYAPGAHLRSALANLFQSYCGRIAPVETWTCHDEEEIYGHYDRIRAAGGEGVIVKDPAAPYETRRSYAWMKIKDCQSLDAPIVGFEAGTGRLSKTLGKLFVDVNGVHVAVGSGLTDALRDELWQTLTESPQDVLGRVIEVEYHEKMPSGSLRHPRFVKFRDVLTGAHE